MLGAPSLLYRPWCHRLLKYYFHYLMHGVVTVVGLPEVLNSNSQQQQHMEFHSIVLSQLLEEKKFLAHVLASTGM